MPEILPNSNVFKVHTKHVPSFTLKGIKSPSPAAAFLFSALRLIQTRGGEAFPNPVEKALLFPPSRRTMVPRPYTIPPRLLLLFPGSRFARPRGKAILGEVGGGSPKSALTFFFLVSAATAAILPSSSRSGSQQGLKFAIASQSGDDVDQDGIG